MKPKIKSEKTIATRLTPRLQKQIAEIQDMHRQTAIIDTGNMSLSTLVELSINNFHGHMMKVYQSIKIKPYPGLSEFQLKPANEPEIPFPDYETTSAAANEALEKMPDPMHIAANDAPGVPQSIKDSVNEFVEHINESEAFTEALIEHFEANPPGPEHQNPPEPEKPNRRRKPKKNEI